MSVVIAVMAVVVAGMAAVMLYALHRRRVLQWLPAYIQSVLARRQPPSGPVHVMFCFVDHFEPRWGGADYATERARMARWCSGYPELCASHRDADGKPPRHTYFFPEEEYRPEHLRDHDAIRRLTELIAEHAQEPRSLGEA